MGLAQTSPGTWRCTPPPNQVDSLAANGTVVVCHVVLPPFVGTFFFFSLGWCHSNASDPHPVSCAVTGLRMLLDISLVFNMERDG